MDDIDKFDTVDLQKKLKSLDVVYHIVEDRQTRQDMLLYMDEIKIELQKRGVNWKNL